MNPNARKAIIRAALCLLSATCAVMGCSAMARHSPSTVQNIMDTLSAVLAFYWAFFLQSFPGE